MRSVGIERTRVVGNARRLAATASALALALALLVLSSPCLAGSDVRPFGGTWYNTETLGGQVVPSLMTVGPEDGTYVMRTGNPPYVVFQSGHLIISGNRVTFRVEDWAPKRGIGGNPISKPPSGTCFYEFPSPDTLLIKSLDLRSVSTWHKQ